MMRSQRRRKTCKIDDITWKTFATELCARKNEYRLQFQAPTLGIVWRIERGKVYVADFADFNGVVLPAQSCCMIGIGDELIMVDRVPLQKMGLVEKTDLLSNLDNFTQNGVELTFRYGRISDITDDASHKRVSLDGRLKHEALFDFLDDDGFVDSQSLEENKPAEEVSNESNSSKYEADEFNLAIGKQELQKRLLELDQLHLSVSIPRIASVQPSNSLLCFYWLRPENESILSILGSKLESFDKDVRDDCLQKKGSGNIELVNDHEDEEDDEGENSLIFIPFLWETDDATKLQSFYGDVNLLSPSSTSTVSSSSGPWANSKTGSKGKFKGRSMSLLSSSLFMRRHFRHELITLTHDSIDQLLRQDSDDMIRTVHDALTRLGVPLSLENSEMDSEHKKETAVVSRNQFEEKKALIDNDSQQNLLYSLFTGLATNGAISTVLSTFNQINTDSFSSNLIQKSSLLVQEVGTQYVFSIPALEPTYSLFYTVLQQLPTFQSSSCHHKHHQQHDHSYERDRDCLVCLLLRWSNSFDSSALWNIYQHRTRQNSFISQKDTVSSAKPTIFPKDRNVYVHFITSVNERGEVTGVRHEEKVDITSYLEIIRDLMTLTVCLLLSKGDLLVYDGHYPFHAIFSSTSREYPTKDTTSSIPSLSNDAFVRLPLRLHLHPSRAGINNHDNHNHQKTKQPHDNSPGCKQDPVVELVERHRGVLHMTLLITAAIRLQHTSLLRMCMIHTEELLFAEQRFQNQRHMSNSIQLSESSQQMLRFLLRPVASGNLSLTNTWIEVFQRHFLPALDAIGCYGSRVNDWEISIFLWLLQQLIHQPLPSQAQDPMENVQDVERQHVLFLTDLCLMPPFCTYTSPFALNHLFFPHATDFNEFMQSAERTLFQLIDAKLRYDREHTAMEGSHEEKEIKCNEEEEDEEDDSHDNDVKVDEESNLLKQWVLTVHPALCRYHHFLTRYVRVMAREEDTLASFAHPKEGLHFQGSWVLDVNPEELTAQLLHVTLLLARYDTWSSMRETQQVQVQQRHCSQPVHSLQKQTTKWHKKNKYLVGVRSLLRKIHRPPGHILCPMSPYTLDPFVAAQLCLKFSFLEGVYVCLDKLRNEEEADLPPGSDCMVGRSIEEDDLWRFFERMGTVELEDAADALTSAINNILKHDSHRPRSQQSQRFHQTVSGPVLRDVVTLIQANFSRYVDYVMRFYVDAEESVFLRCIDWLGHLFNRLVKLSMDILHPEVFLSSSCDWDTIGDTGTVTQFLAEWCVFVLLKCVKSTKTKGNFELSEFFHHLMDESSSLIQCMSVEYILYLRQEGFLK